MAANYGDKTFKFCVMGDYGKFYSNHIRAFENTHVFIDIGANQGLYTVLAAKNPNCRRVYAFEPVAKTFSLLKRNVELNQVVQKCRLIRSGIAEASGEREITSAARHSGAASLIRENVENAETYTSEKIRVIDANDLSREIAERDVPIAVKVDVEGYEPQVLTQLLNTEFSKSIFEIFFEVDERWVDVQSITAFLERHGFTRFERVGKGGHYDLLASR